MITDKYIVSIEFTPNELYASELPEKFYIKTPLGNMLNPKLSLKSQIQLHDMAIFIDEIRRISNSRKQVKSKLTFDTDFGRLDIKITTVGIVFNLLDVFLLTFLTASTVSLLAYFLFR